jgi:hypothetical protein
MKVAKPDWKREILKVTKIFKLGLGSAWVAAEKLNQKGKLNRTIKKSNQDWDEWRREYSKMTNNSGRIVKSPMKRNCPKYQLSDATFSLSKAFLEYSRPSW